MKSILCSLPLLFSDNLFKEEVSVQPVVEECCELERTSTNFFAEASFLYWLGGEEGLSLTTNGVFSSQPFLATQSNLKYQDFAYKPGFKVKLGVDSAGIEYTYLRGTTHKSIHASNDINAAGSSNLGTPILLVGDWFLNGSQVGQALWASSVSSKWQYSIDLIDLFGNRSFCYGDSLIVNPFGGIRGACIRQRMTVHASGIISQNPPSNPISSRNESSSWGIGPKFGVELAWLFSSHFKFEVDLAASLL